MIQLCNLICTGKIRIVVILFIKGCILIDFAVKQFGSDVKIVLTGISMGAATVLMASGKQLPKNVVGVLADCGFSSPKEIIKKCAKDQHYPVKLIYPFIKLSAKIFGHFDLEEYSPLEAMKTCKVPVIFFHGLFDRILADPKGRIPLKQFIHFIFLLASQR